LVSINFKTNVGFFLVLISVVVLALIEGNHLFSNFTSNRSISASEVQQITFIALTIFIIAIAVFQPYKISMVAYSAMTLGLVVLITSFFDRSSTLTSNIKIIQISIGVVLIIAGSFMNLKTRVTEKDEALAEQGIRYFKK